jgi:thiaminase/transcriptional activator TenA
MTISRELVECSSELWPRVYSHPFVRAVADGSLDDDAFARWIAADHYFNIEYQRFIAGLVATAPTPRSVEVISVGLASVQSGLDRIRRVAARFDIDLDVDPGPTTVGFTAYLQSRLLLGWEVGLAALYASEKVYFDAWSSIRPTARRDTPYWTMADVWSDEIFGHWISAVCRQVDLACLEGPTPAMHLAFDRVIRFELLFWTAVYTGDTW